MDLWLDIGCGPNKEQGCIGIDHYNFKNVDIGPSTENSEPNYGLCEFKEGIGCKIVPKYTFSKEIN